MNELKLNELSTMLKIVLTNQLNLVEKGKFSSIPRIVGPAGIGKSEFVKSLVKQMEKETGIQWGLKVHYLGTFPLEKMTGLPLSNDVEDEFTKWSKPDVFDFKTMEVPVKDLNKPYKILMLLDDIHLVKSNMLPYLYQLYSYRSIHGYKLPDNVAIITAGNGKDDNAGFQKTHSPIINREVYFNVKCDVDQWITDFAIDAGVEHEIIAFLNNNGNMLYTESINDGPFATPRSWESLSNQLKQMKDMKIKDNDTNEMLAVLANGTVGTEASGNFIEFINLIYKWNGEDILDGKEKFNINDLDKIDTYALLSAVTGEFIKRMRKNLITNKEIKSLQDITKACEGKHKVIIPVALSLIIKAEIKINNTLDISQQLLDNEIIQNIKHMIN